MIAVQPGGKRVALIGAGGWGRNHVRTLAAMDELAIVFDPDPRAVDTVAELAPGTKLSSRFDADEARAAGAVAVVVATPAVTHPEITMAAIGAGFDVLVEKPMALTGAGARAMRDAADAAGRMLMVGHLLLFQPAYTAVRVAIAGGEIGGIRSIHQTRRNFGRARQVENALWSLGVHDIALVLSIADSPVVAVEGVGQDVRGTGVADESVVHLRFANGSQAHVTSSWLWPDKSRGLMVVGERGFVEFDEVTNTGTVWHRWIDGTGALRDEGHRPIVCPDGEPLRIELEHFLDAVANRRVPVTDAASGVAVTEVLERAEQAIVSANRIERPR